MPSLAGWNPSLVSKAQHEQVLPGLVCSWVSFALWFQIFLEADAALTELLPTITLFSMHSHKAPPGRNVPDPGMIFQRSEFLEYQN